MNDEHPPLRVGSAVPSARGDVSPGGKRVEELIAELAKKVEALEKRIAKLERGA
ncbi:MAG: hypothetical protein WA751_10235 [Candidatus Dormiibacterota bacterium]